MEDNDGKFMGNSGIIGTWQNNDGEAARLLKEFLDERTKHFKGLEFAKPNGTSRTYSKR